MKKTVFLLLIFLITSCSSSDSKEIEKFKFSGYYSGTFTRNGEQGNIETGNGTIFFTIHDDREIEGGYDVVNLTYFSLDGTIDENGNLQLFPTGFGVGNAATFDGKIINGTINGTWADPSRNWTGVFTASKLYEVTN